MHAPKSDPDSFEDRVAKLRIGSAATPPEPGVRRFGTVLIAGLAGVLGTALVAFLLWPARDPGKAEPPPEVTPAPVDAARGGEGLVMGGYVKAGVEIHLGSAVSGVVHAMYVSPGSHVVVGQKIAELASDTLKAQVAQMRANVLGREAELRQLRNGALPQELAQATARVAEVQAEVEGKRRELQRQQSLAEGGLVPQSALDDAQQAYDMARARFDSIVKEQELLRRGPRAEAIQRAEANLAEARASLGLAEAQLEQTVIRSPIEGVVTQKHAEVGELVSAGFGGGAAAALVTIADISRLIVEIDVPHADLQQIHLGQAAWVESEALGARRFAGRVSWIGPEANRQKLSVPIQVEVLGPHEGLLPGLSAKVTIRNEDRKEEGAP